MTDAEKLQKFLAQATHMMLAVTLADGTPWIVPVRIQRAEGAIFEWDSKIDTVHSQALTQHPAVALTIFLKEKGAEVGFYAKASAKEVSRRNDGYARYRATVSEAWLNDETFIKRKISL
jgi:nitroimidazol reductase NimA-like FMN-containing flavoprotein (pyridoxamine 5'-phosphate oxidase superfamily)